MFKKLFRFMARQPESDTVEAVGEATAAPVPRASIIDGGSLSAPSWNMHQRLAGFAKLAPVSPDAVAMDGITDGDADCDTGINNAKGYTQGQPNISDELSLWYASQSFIGHQLAALVAQHWLISKACAQPARDAIRNGFEIVSNDPSKELEPTTIATLNKWDKKFRLRSNLLEFLTLGRTFGIRICLFVVDYDDPVAAYSAPFNIDGVKPSSYRGMVQVDPYWCSPELDGAAASQPDTQHFYEPTHWIINGKRYHRTHLVIYRHGYLADILKPAYMYGGVPVPQLIMERVYGAERTANEAPLLALTKRTIVYKTDIAKAISNWDRFTARLADMTRLWTNRGIRVIDKEEDDHQQFDTGLADLDSLIMTQYQIVAAAAEVPSTKLLGTAPKGFNATGEFDESSYHESLQSIQEHDLTPLVQRHHLLTLKSCGIVADTDISWHPLDTPTAKEYAEINAANATADAALVGAGAIDGMDVRQRLANDKNSGYSGVVVGGEDGDPETAI